MPAFETVCEVPLKCSKDSYVCLKNPCASLELVSSRLLPVTGRLQTLLWRPSNNCLAAVYAPPLSEIIFDPPALYPEDASQARLI